MLTFEHFHFSTKKLNRFKDENVFQLQLGKYLNTLRVHLESIAHELMYGGKIQKNVNHCNKILRDNIDIYLDEFLQKSKSL